jgi:hypothetical protein
MIGGPFEILKQVGPCAYVVELPPDVGNSLTCNVSDLLACKEPTVMPDNPLEPSPPLGLSQHLSVHQPKDRYGMSR